MFEYILYCDESSASGEKYGDFFGGCLVDVRNIEKIGAAITHKKEQLNLNGEIKWTKVTESYLDKYCEIIDVFFEYIRSGHIKMRIMFRKNDPAVTEYYRSSDKHERYFKLYYQFIKHAFGLRYAPPCKIRIYLDNLPDRRSDCDEFKDFIYKMQLVNRYNHIHIRKEDIAEVRSHDHVLLQCADIVLGAMYFRLNGLHMKIPNGQRLRGKKTRAKEHLYKHIHKHINEMHPNFNIGISTGSYGRPELAWEGIYRHWKFEPKI